MMRLLSILILCLIALPASADNLIPNSSFETDRGWIAWGGGNTTDAYGNHTNLHNKFISTNDTAHGNRVFSLQGGRLISKPFYALPGSYRFTFSARGDPGNLARLDWGYSGERGSQIDPPNNVTLSTSWQRFTNSITLTSVSNYVVKFEEWNGSQVIIDAVQFETGTVASAFSPIPIEFGFSTTNLDNNFMAGETPAVNLDFWNDGASTSATAVWRIYDAFNRVMQATTNTVSLAPNSATTLPVVLPVTNGYMRLHGYLAGIDNSWDELSISKLPYTRTTAFDTNGVLGIHTHYSRYHSQGLRQAGFRWGRGLSPGLAVRWSIVEASAVSGFDWSAMDYYVTGQATNGQVLMATLSGWPSWAVDGAGNPSNNLYINFVTNAVDRYRNYIWHWELMNEPQNPAENNGWTWWQNYTNLSRLMADAAAAIKSMQSTGVVVGMGGIGDGAYAYQVFTNMTVGERANLDAVSAHIYPQAHSADPNNPEDDYTFSVSAYPWRQNFIAGNIKPVWNTESGIWISTGYRGDGYFYGLSYFEPFDTGYSPEVLRNEPVARTYVRTDMILQTAARSLGWGFKRFFYYDGRYPNSSHLSDGVNGADPTIYEFNSSFKPDGVGLLMLQHYGGVGIDRVTNTSSANIEAYLIPNATFGNVIVAWNLDRTNRTLTFTNAEIAVVDAFGNGIQTNSLTARVTRNLRYYLSGSLTQNQLSNTFKYASVADATDTLAPAVSIDVSPIGPVDGSRRLFKWTAIEDTSVPWYQNNHDTNIVYKYRFQPGSAYSDLSQSNHVWASFGPGIYNLDVVAYDAKGNSSQAVLGPEFSVGEQFYLRNFLNATQQLQVVIWPCESNKITATTALTNVADGGNLQQYQQLSGSRMAAALEVKAIFTGQVALISGLAPTNQSRQFGYIGINTNASSTETWLYEFTNGWGGFRIVNPIAANSNLLAIQALILRNGQRICETNYVYTDQDNGTVTDGGTTWKLPLVRNNVTNRTITWIDAGPLYCKLKVRDEFPRAAWTSGAFSQSDGTGYLDTYIEFEAHSKSVVVYQDTDTQIAYYYDLPEMFRPSTNGAQWRLRQTAQNHGSETGYLWGQTTNTIGPALYSYYDLLRDIYPDRQIKPYFANTTDWDGIAYLTIPWHMGGVQVYASTENGSRPLYLSFGNTNHSSSSNIIGFFEGPIGWQEEYPWQTPLGIPLIAKEGTWISPFYFTNSPGTNMGMMVLFRHHDGTGRTNYHHRFAYGIYLGGTNGTWINSTNPHATDIEAAYCLHSGMPARDVLVGWQCLDGDLGPKGNYGEIMGTNIQPTIAAMKAGDTALAALVRAITANVNLFNIWTNTSGAVATNVATNLLYTVSTLNAPPLPSENNSVATTLQMHWGAGGLYNAQQRPLTGGSANQRLLQEIDQALADPLLVGHRSELRSSANILCRMAFAHNWRGFPTNWSDIFTGVGGGGIQLDEAGFKNVAANYATNDPFLAFARATSSNNSATVFLNICQDDGAMGGSTAYLGVTSAFSLIDFVQLKARGVNVMNSADIAIKVTNHCEYLLALDVGIDYRDSEGRIFVFGDTQTGRTGHAAAWAIMVQDVQPVLYDRMIRKFYQDGRTINSYSMEGVLWLDLNSPTNSRPIARSRFGTGTGALFHFATESTNAAHAMFQSDGWGVNENFGHGYNAVGEAYLYAYGAPISIQFHAYGISPYAAWPQTRPMVMRTTSWPTWNDPTADSTLIDNSDGYNANSAVHTNTLFFAYSGNADTMVTNLNGKTWYRQFSPVTVSPNFQVYQYNDRFNTADTNLIQHALYATNDVGGDLGTLIPPERNMSAGEAPRAGTNVSFTPGLKVLTLTGTPLAAHPAGGLDFQLAILNTSPSNTLNAYAVSHDVTSHEEQIYVHYDVTNGDSLSWIVARPKGVGAPTITTNPATSALILVTATEEMHVRSNSWEFAAGTSSIGAATFDGNTLTATNGIGISGGPAEAVISRSSTTNIIVSASGSIGLRTITNSTLPYPLIIATDGQSSRTTGIRRQ